MSKYKHRILSYVGYTNNIKKRINDHNSSNGAKYTRGKKWIIIYKKSYITKSLAMKNEYKLKNDRNLRNKLKYNFLKNNENFNFTTI
tara:strand:+ start:248 stop:508 length:261 start_codon:yes stop_codon:yes gene_type:complete